MANPPAPLLHTLERFFASVPRAHPLQHSTMYCNTFSLHLSTPLAGFSLQCATCPFTPTLCNIMEHAATQLLNILSGFLPHCTALIHCNTPQHTATHCNTKLYDTRKHPTSLLHTLGECFAALPCNCPLQNSATRCNTLQHTAENPTPLLHTLGGFFTAVRHALIHDL